LKTIVKSGNKMMRFLKIRWIG